VSAEPAAPPKREQGPTRAGSVAEAIERMTAARVRCDDALPALEARVRSAHDAIEQSNDQVEEAALRQFGDVHLLRKDIAALSQRVERSMSRAQRHTARTFTRLERRVLVLGILLWLLRNRRRIVGTIATMVFAFLVWRYGNAAIFLIQDIWLNLKSFLLIEAPPDGGPEVPSDSGPQPPPEGAPS